MFFNHHKFPVFVAVLFILNVMFRFFLSHSRGNCSFIVKQTNKKPKQVGYHRNRLSIGTSCL